MNRKDLLHKYKKLDEFWKNVFKLFSGSALAQAIPILVFPLITRIYSKESLGVYFVYSSIILLSQILASLQYHLAIVLPEKESDANSLLNLNFVLSFLVSLLFLFLILVFYPVLKDLIKEIDLLRWICLAPLSTFLLGVFNAISYYFNRHKKFAAISKARIVKSISFCVFQIGFGFLGYVRFGLIGGLLLGQFFSLVYLLMLLIREKGFSFEFSYVELKRIALVYKDIPLFNTLLSGINSLSNQLPVFLLSRYFGVSAAADYGLSNRIVNTPMGLISQSVGQVFYKESSDLVNRAGNLMALVKKTYKQMFRVALLPFLSLLIVSPWLFKLLFSDAYLSAGVYTQWLIPWFFISFINMPFTFLTTTLNKQKQLLLYNILLLLFRFLSLFAAYYFFNDVLCAVILFSATGVAFNVYLFWYLRKIAAEFNSTPYRN